MRALALLLLALSACTPGGSGIDGFDLVVDTDGVVTLNVQIERGDLVLYDNADADEVQVVWVVNDDDAATHDSALVSGTANGATASIQASPPTASDTARVDLEIHCPQGLSYVLQLDDGDLEADVSLDDGTSFSGQTTTSGIELWLPGDAAVDLNASGADVSFDGLDFDGTNMMGNAVGTIGGGGASVTLQAAGDVLVGTR